jgi:hypothetical protein
VFADVSLPPNTQLLYYVCILVHTNVTTTRQSHLYAELVIVLVLSQVHLPCTPDLTEIGAEAAVNQAHHALQLEQPPRLNRWTGGQYVCAVSRGAQQQQQQQQQQRA